MREWCILSTIIAVLALQGCASHSVSLWSENDSFATAGSDYTNYSNGIQLAFAPAAPHVPCPDDCDDGLFESFIDFINIAEQRESAPEIEQPVWVRYGFGQQFFTPDDVSVATLQTDERPYAGWLYGFLDVSNEHFDPRSELHYRHNVSLRLGVIGPASLGEDLQKLWHGRCDCPEPQGWDHQLENEPGLVFSVGHDRRLLRRDVSDSWSYDLIGSVGGSIGNVYTGADVGGIFRFGWHLDRGWGARTMDDVGFHATPTAGEGAGFFVFAGSRGRYVARDIFLDGNTWEASHSVDRDPLVFDHTVGFGIHWDQFDVNVSYVYRSEQYATQPSPTRFGSFVISWRPKE